MSKELSLCPDCNCMTKNICGKCGLQKIKNELKNRVFMDLIDKFHLADFSDLEVESISHEITNTIEEVFNKHASKEVKE